MHDYVCDRCGHALTDVYRPVSVRASDDRPKCPHCCRLMDWIPQVGRMDAYEPNAEFDHVLKDGTTVHIDSLAKLRAVERDSEQRARNGEGEQLRWRDYSQDKSNTDAHSFAKSLTDPHGDIAARNAGIAAQKARAARLGQPVGINISRGDAVTTKHGTID